MTETAELSQRAAERAALPAAVRPRLSMPSWAAAAARKSTPLASIRGALEDRRLFLLMPFAMIAGLILAVTASGDAEPWALAAVGLVLVVAMVAARRRLALFRVLILALMCWAGFSLVSLHGALFGTPMLRAPLYGAFSVRVEEVLAAAPGRSTFVVSDIVPGADTRAAPMRRARLSVRDAPAVLPGDTLSGRMRFYPVPAPVIPGGYDAEFQSYFHGIGAYGSSIGALTVTRGGSGWVGTRLVERVRRAMAARISTAIGEPSASVAKAIVIGDQSGIPDDVRDAMATAGIAHVLSISGLHLSIVAGGTFAALRILLALLPGLTRRLAAKKLAALTGMLAAFAYYSISGGSVAALRSTIMIALVFGAVIVGRQALTMRNVAIAALVIILTDPASVFRPSFQLSFAAVVGLIGVYEGWRKPQTGRGWPGRIAAWVIGAVVTSFVAGAATLLFSVYHFQQSSPLGVLGNLLVLPLVAFVIMPSAAFGVLAMPFGLDRPLLVATGWGIDRMLDCARFVARLSGGIEATPLLTPVALVIGLAALAWFAFLRDRWRLLGPALALPAVLAFAVDRPPDVLVSDTTLAVAVRGPDGLDLVSGKPGSFALRVWAETYGEPSIETVPGFARCDSLGCIAASTAGFTVSVVKAYDAFAEDCAMVDLVITHLYAPDYCRGETEVIDAGDLARNGVYWLSWRDGRFQVRATATNVTRPWRAGQS